VAHTCNPSYSRGRDQEDHNSKLTEQRVHKTLSQKKTSQKRAGEVAQVVSPEFKPWHCKTKKKERQLEVSYKTKHNLVT
jgi:hypothetical protein